MRKGRDLSAILGSLDDEEVQTSKPAEVQRSDPPKVVPVNLLVTPEDRHRLKQLALDSNSSLQKLGHEAWNLLLEKRGLAPLEPVTANVPSGRRR